MSPIALVAALKYQRKLAALVEDQKNQEMLRQLGLPTLVLTDPSVVKVGVENLLDSEAPHAEFVQGAEPPYIACYPAFFESNCDTQLYILCHELRHAVLRQTKGFIRAHSKRYRMHFKWGIWLPCTPVSFLDEFISAPIEAEIERWLIGHFPRVGNQQLQLRLQNSRVRLAEMRTAWDKGESLFFPACFLRLSAPAHFLMNLSNSKNVDHATQQECKKVSKQLASLLEEIRPKLFRKKDFRSTVERYLYTQRIMLALQAADDLLEILYSLKNLKSELAAPKL